MARLQADNLSPTYALRSDSHEDVPFTESTDTYEVDIVYPRTGVADIDATIDFYTSMTPLVLIDRREDDAGYGAWLSSGAQDWNPQAEPLSWHLTAIAITTAATFATAWALQRWTRSAMPLTDAFTTVFSLWATWLMVQNHHANWAYWIAIDAVAIVLYAKRGLPLGAALYAIYLAMAVMGWFGW